METSAEIQKILLQAQKNTMDRLYIPSVFRETIEVKKNGNETVVKLKKTK